MPREAWLRWIGVRVGAPFTDARIAVQVMPSFPVPHSFNTVGLTCLSTLARNSKLIKIVFFFYEGRPNSGRPL